MIKFACISPHPPIILPDIGSKEDRLLIKKTIDSLDELSRRLDRVKPDSIIISSPHPDWGFQVPLYFIAKDFNGEIKNYLTGLETPQFYFEEGKKIYKELDEKKKYAFIASGDLSHCLKKDGPYGFQAEGPEFDKELMELLEKKDIGNILKLDEKYPQAGECGLRSICFMTGILEAANINWEAEILSYEGPFGVGYLVVNFDLI